MEDHDAHAGTEATVHMRVLVIGRSPALSYRQRAALGVIQRCREIGVALIANGTGVHAVPTGRLLKFPGMVHLVQRYRPEIMQQLDESVE